MLKRFRKTEHIEKLHFFLIMIIRIALILAIIFAAFEQRWMILFVSLLTFMLTFLPYLVEKNYHVELPPEFEILIILFIYASLFMGEVHGYYTRFWWWDVVLHAGSALALGFAGFLILYTLYKTQRFKASPKLLILFSFCFALALGATWEIFEFSMDSVFRTNMQKSGLKDTMWDLILDAVGASIAAISGYFYIKKKEIFIFDKLVKRFEKKNPKLFKKSNFRNL